MMAIAKAMDSEKMEVLPMINGFTVVSSAEKKLTMESFSAVAGDWTCQEEQDHYAIQQPYVITPYTCPTSPNPVPTCPVCPTCPTNPGQPTNPGNPTPVESPRSWGIERTKAHLAKGILDTSKVVVGIIDTGIDLQHPGNGRVLASIGYAGAVQDRAGHGSHVAGTIAGKRGTGLGVSEAGLAICKGLSDSGSGSSSQLANCLVWMLNAKGADGQPLNIKIVSNSWGSTASDQLINQAIAQLTQRGVAVVVANGNDGRGTLNWPAQLAISNPLVFGVAASDSQNRKADFSTYGSGTKYIAPGVDIVSNAPGGGTQSMSGTSMATPHVAGAMAYCVAAGLPPNCLKTTNIGLPANVQGAGLIDVLATAQSSAKVLKLNKEKKNDKAAKVGTPNKTKRKSAKAG